MSSEKVSAGCTTLKENAMSMQPLMRYKFFFALFSMMLIVVGNAQAEIKLGILPRLSTMEIFSMFSPLAEYLSRETGEKVSIVIPRNFDEFKAGVRSGQLDLGFANPLIYIQLKQDADVFPLALSAEKKGGTKFRGIILVRKDSGIETVEDLRMKRLVFVEKDSAAGYLFQMLYLNSAGFDVHKDFTILPFAKKHDNVVLAVFNRVADAGGIREDTLETMQGKLDLSQLKVLAYTDYFPSWPLFATAKLSKEKAEKIKTALLKLKIHSSQSSDVLGRAQLTGFKTVMDSEFDQLRKAAKLVGAM